MKIILVGKSNAGKTYFANKLTGYGWREAISTTSRPKRDTEENGVHYHFVSKAEFELGKKQNKFAEVEEFNGWYYGLTHEEIDKSNLFVLTPRGVTQFVDILKVEDTFIIYIENTIQIKFARIFKRDGLDDESHRRWVNDDVDFDKFDRYQKWDMKISVNEGEAIDKLLKIIKING